jgi:hypothetical protein
MLDPIWTMTRLAFINAALNLDFQLDHGSGWAGAFL